MKQLRLFKMMLLMCLLVSGISTAWGEEVTWTALDAGYTNGAEVKDVTVNSNISFAFDKGTNSNVPKFYTTGTAVRCYGGNTIVVNATDATITGITFTFGSGDGTNEITANVETFSSPNWSGSESAVTFTIGGTTGHRRIASIKVTYTKNVASVSHKVYFYSNGDILNDGGTDVEEGAVISFPTNPLDISGKTFVGWMEGTIDGTTNEKPTLVNNATMGTIDITYHAVFATKTIDGSEEIWEKADIEDLTVTDVFVFTDGNNHAISTANETSASPKGVEISVQDDKITSEVIDDIKWNVSGNNNSGYIFAKNGTTGENNLYCNTDASSGSNANIRVGNGDRKYWAFTTAGYIHTKDKYVGRYLSYYVDANDFRGYTGTTNGAFLPVFYKKIGGVTYSDYCTSVPKPVDYVTLPWEWTGGGKDGLLTISGVKGIGLGTDYAEANAPYLVKFDTTGDYIQVKTNEPIGKCEVGVKKIGGGQTSSIIVQGSSDGTTFEYVQTLTISGEAEEEIALATSGDLNTNYRFVRFMFVKGANVGVGNIKIETPTGNAIEPSNVESISVTGTPEEFWKNQEFSYEGIIVTATYSDGTSEIVNNEDCVFSGYRSQTTGTQTITVYYEGKSDSYEINVKTIANTPETAYTVAEAIAFIEAGKDLSTEVYVKGIISGIVDAYNEQYGNISFDISSDGSLEGDQFRFYRNQKTKAEKYEEDPNLEIGASVIGCGKLRKFYEIYEFDAGNYLYSYEAPVHITWSANGDETIGAYPKGANIDFASNVPDTPTLLEQLNLNSDWTFRGWVLEGTTVSEDAEPTYVTSASAEGDATYVAVFAIAPKEAGKPYTDFTTNLYLVLDEAKTTFDREFIGEYDRVKVKRSMSAGTLSTLCLPFDMSHQKIEEIFDGGIKIWELVGFEHQVVDGNDSYKLICSESEEILCGKPYLIEISKDCTQFEVDNVWINTQNTPTDITVWTADNSNQVIFHGTYIVKGVNKDEGNYIIDKFNKFIPVTSSDPRPIGIKGFRGYFQIPGVNTTNVTKEFLYKISIASDIANGTVSAEYDKAPEGKLVSLTPTPDSGYELASWNVTYVQGGETKTITVTDNKFTMPAANVTVSATFKPIVYTINWSVNGEIVSTETASVGTNLNVPTVNVPDYTTKVFIGWVEEEIFVPTDDRPVNILRPTEATKSTTYYALFADKNSSTTQVVDEGETIAYWGKQKFTANSKVLANEGVAKDDVSLITSFTNTNTQGDYSYQYTFPSNGDNPSDAEILISGLNLSAYEGKNISLTFATKTSSRGNGVLAVLASTDGVEYQSINNFGNLPTNEISCTTNNIPSNTQFIKIAYGTMDVGVRNTGAFYFGMPIIKAYNKETHLFTKLTEENTANWDDTDWEGYYVIAHENNALSGAAIAEKNLFAITPVDDLLQLSSVNDVFRVQKTDDNKYTVQGIGYGLYLAPSGTNSVQGLRDVGYVKSIGYNSITAINDYVLYWNSANNANKFGFYGSAQTALPTLYKIMDDVTYTGYTTRLVSIKLSDKCNDSAKHHEKTYYYGSYSNAYAFIVPEDLRVAVVGVDENSLLVVNEFKTGDVVPANTGLMVSSENYGDHEIVLTNKETSALPGVNNLRPSGPNGITPETMASNDPNCIYYRLTMHQGTQIGYWWGAENGGAFGMSANKAYLVVPEGTQVKSGAWFSDDELNGIENISISSNTGEIYNLNGQRVITPVRGQIYIMNGHKFIAK